MSLPEEKESVTMGAGIRDQFMFEDGVAVCNHGSYGTVPRVVFNERIRLLEEMEKQPDRWFRRTVRLVTTE